jgi:hypothetical protein
MPYADRNKQREAQLRSYHKNKDKYRDRINKRRRVNRDEMRRRAIVIKESSSCADCGVDYPHYVMDFDHVRGEKIGSVCRLINSYCSWKMVKEEIDKCEVVCSNCHRTRHRKESC